MCPVSQFFDVTTCQPCSDENCKTCQNIGVDQCIICIDSLHHIQVPSDITVTSVKRGTCSTSCPSGRKVVTESTNKYCYLGSNNFWLK